MTKLTKSQRRTQKQKKEIKRQREKDLQKKHKELEPWVAPEMNYYEVPNFIDPDLPFSERLNLIRKIGNEANQQFEEKYPAIQRWFTEFDAVYLLSMCMHYFTLSPEGIDPEAKGRLEFPPHFLEIMQALALYQPRKISATPLLEKMGILKEEMREIGDLMSLRLLSFPESITTEEELNAHRLRTDMMSNTTAIRNWAYPHQMKEVLLDLATTIKDEFRVKYGICPILLFKMLYKLLDEREVKINEHIDKLRPMMSKRSYMGIIESYYQAFPHMVRMSEKEIEDLWELTDRNVDNLRSYFLIHSDLRLEDLYSFTIDQVAKLADEEIDQYSLKSILDQLSFKFGDLSTINFDKNHIVLNNPVLSRPFIKIDETKYFSSIWGVVPHLMLGLLEDLISGDESIKKNYSRAKALYLENKLEKLAIDSFPNAKIFAGSLWRDPDNKRQYENDLIILIDSFAIVIEAKSASITDPARRGAPDRLTRTLKELIEEPSDQAHRFIQFLKENRHNHALGTKSGKINEIDSSTIKYFIPIGVTLSHLGSIGSNLKKIVNSKVTNRTLEQLAPSISICDLECIFELLPLEIEKIHYLARRREFEAHLHFEGDELDLLSFYLGTGFNIGSEEYNNDLAINMSMKSKELDPYFIGSRVGAPVKKPELKLTKWWADIINRISHVKSDGWIETGFILLNMRVDDQSAFKRNIDSLSNRILFGKVDMPHNFVIWSSNIDRRRFKIIAYPYEHRDKEICKSVLGEAIGEQTDNLTRGTVGIGIDLHHRPNYPYTLLARTASTNLLDELTL